MDHVVVEVSDPIATVILNRPEARNAISREMVLPLDRVFAELAHDRSVRCVAIRAAGEHFCSGGGVKGFREPLSLAPGERRLPAARSPGRVSHFSWPRTSSWPARPKPVSSPIPA